MGYVRNVAVSAAILALAAPAQAKEPRSVDESARSVDDLAGCIALKLTEISGYEVRKQQILSGLELKLKFRVAGVAATAATFLIEDLGERRRLTIFATGKATGAPRTLAERARQCVA